MTLGIQKCCRAINLSEGILPFLRVERREAGSAMTA